MDQLFAARAKNLLDERGARLAFLETGLDVLAWLALAIVVGIVPFIFIFIVPTLIGNDAVRPDHRRGVRDPDPPRSNRYKQS